MYIAIGLDALTCGLNITDRTNVETCIVHQPNADVMDVVFQICQLTCAIVPPAVVAAGKIISSLVAGTWGGALPVALQEYPDQDLVRAIFTNKGISGLAELRKDYIVGACVHALGERVKCKTEQLQQWVKSHNAVLLELDRLCDVAELDALSTGYGTAFVELLKKGSVTMAELSEESGASSHSEKEKDTGSAAGSATTNADQASGAADGRLCSLRELSKLCQADQVNAFSLSTTESLHELRLLIAADMMAKSRPEIVLVVPSSVVMHAMR